MLRIKTNIPSVIKKLKGKRDKIKSTILLETRKEAFRTHKDISVATPRRYTGKTRRDWRFQRISSNPPFYTVFNNNQVMNWLENGTQTRTPRKAKNLFIPLRASAWKAGGYKKGMVWGQDFVFAKSARGIKALKLVPKQVTKTKLRITMAVRLAMAGIK